MTEQRKQFKKRSGLLGILLVLLTMHALAWAQAAEERITVKEFFLHEKESNGIMKVDLELNYELTDFLRESLLNGVTLRNEIRFNLVLHNEWWWDKTEPVTRIVSELKYHALSRNYRVLNIDSGESWNFSSLAASLDHIGKLKGYQLPKLGDSVLKEDAALYIDAVLAPQNMQTSFGLSTLFSQQNQLTSQGVMWPLTP